MSLGGESEVAVASARSPLAASIVDEDQLSQLLSDAGYTVAPRPPTQRFDHHPPLHRRLADGRAAGAHPSSCWRVLTPARAG
ncbi:MAG: hypothetical protein R2856_38105 [Caldilineaceae bacterium]